MASDKLEATLLKPKAMVVLTAVIQAAEVAVVITAATQTAALTAEELTAALEAEHQAADCCAGG